MLVIQKNISSGGGNTHVILMEKLISLSYIIFKNSNNTVSYCLIQTFFYSLPPAIEDDYSGPKLEDGKVTLKFMKELMDWFKDQKKLHRKFAYQVNALQVHAYT